MAAWAATVASNVEPAPCAAAVLTTVAIVALIKLAAAVDSPATVLEDITATAEIAAEATLAASAAGKVAIETGAAPLAVVVPEPT